MVTGGIENILLQNRSVDFCLEYVSLGNLVVDEVLDGNTRTYTYNIETSTDGSSWTIVVPTKTGSSIVADMFNQVTARMSE